MRLQEPFALRPSEADHQKAQRDFEAEVARFAEELREWLNEYAVAVRAYANTFEVAVVLRMPIRVLMLKPSGSPSNCPRVLK
jgi:hypothetical protein